MGFRLLMAAALLVAVVVAVTWPADQGQVREQIQQKKIVLGQSPRDIRTVIGEPTRITRTQTVWGSTEDWIYGEGKGAISLTFEEGKLTRISGAVRSDPQ